MTLYKQTGLSLVKLYLKNSVKVRDMPRTATDARDKILAIADHLFYREGIRAIGVDLIIAQSEVAKTTLYRYFPSKDELVVAYLEGRNQQFWQLLEAAIAPFADDPKQQLLAIFAWLDQLLASEKNYGCPFLMVASEFPATAYPGHQVAIAHKKQMGDRLVALATAMGIQATAELSASLMLIVDGAFAQRRLYQAHTVNLQAIAKQLIQSQEGLG
jgi:AcrR family transcriptional regulator